MPKDKGQEISSDEHLPRSWDTFDTLIEKAFAPRNPSGSAPLTKSPSNSKTRPESLKRPSAPEPPSNSNTTSVYSQIPLSAIDVGDDEEPDVSLDPIWEKVRQKKAAALAKLPSKVKSLEGVMTVEASGSNMPTPVPPSPPQKVQGTPIKRLVKKASIVSFKESPDGRMMTATIDMPGVNKQDMHVSFRPNRLVVTWRKVKVVERMEEHVLVRDRREKQYNQMIPLPEETKFEDIRASRDGRRLTIIYPNICCTRILSEASSTAISGGTEFYTCAPEAKTVEVDQSV